MTGAFRHRASGWLHAIFALIALAAWVLPGAADARTVEEIRREGVLRAGVNPNFPPMSVYGAGNQLVGFDVDVAREFAKRLGVRLQLVPTEAAQRVPFLVSGRIDLSLGALTVTPERAKLIDYSVPLHSEAMGVITTAKVPASRWEDLDKADITLVNMRGNQSVEVLREKLPKPQRLLVDGNADTIRAIAQGRADALVENVDFFVGFTKNYPDVQWRVLADPIFVAYCAVGIAKGNGSLQTFLNAQLLDMHESGVVDALWRKWYDASMTVPVPAEMLVASPVAVADASAVPAAYSFSFGETLAQLPYLLGGALISLQIAFISFWSGAVIGLFGAVGKQYGGNAVRRVIDAYVTLFTNTPALVQIFLLYYALPDAGIKLASMTAVLIGLSLNAGAYLTEIIRGGLASVRKSEMEAAVTLGMKPRHILVHVMLPHIARTIFGPLSNFFVWLVLGSSMAALFGVEELTGRAINISTANLRTIETFAIVGGIYVVLTIAASASLALVGRYVFRVRARVF
ncbi:ABC transporter substrate-binding protein/permease [Sphingoaurantiacus capsulatus]|uniref:ABC transporter substrate-binding protein/permease n=1 Tax=Sphingoaurantiacus capsulatus TaxID=1771310 RepID=A0ABV7XC35_9SPHN